MSIVSADDGDGSGLLQSRSRAHEILGKVLPYRGKAEATEQREAGGKGLVWTSNCATNLESARRCRTVDRVS